MKLMKLIISATLLLTLHLAAVAAPKVERELVTQIFEAEIHCESCQAKVMNTLPFKKGVKDVNVDMTTQQITVKYDASKSSDSAIIESLQSVAVKANVKQAEDGANSQEGSESHTHTH